MNAVVTQKLRAMILDNGRSVVFDPKRCEEIMAGELADFASSARVLRMALRCGIPAALAKDARSDAELAGLTLSLQHQGVSEMKARDAMETWAEAIGQAPARTIDPGGMRTNDSMLAAAWQEPSPAPAAAAVTAHPAAPAPVKTDDMPPHKAAAIAAAAAIAFDLIVGVVLMGTLPMPLVTVDVALLAASASLYRKNSPVIAWIIFAVALFRGVFIAVAVSAASPLTSLLTFGLLLHVLVARFAFKAAIANRTTASEPGENKLEGVQEAL